MYTKIGFLGMKINTATMCKVGKITNTPKRNMTHQICTASNTSLNHAPRTFSTQQKQNTFLMNRHLKAYSNGSTHGNPLLQVASNEQSTAEPTTCMTFKDTSRKYYPTIVVFRLWARCVGQPIFLTEVAVLN